MFTKSSRFSLFVNLAYVPTCQKQQISLFFISTDSYSFIEQVFANSPPISYQSTIHTYIYIYIDLNANNYFYHNIFIYWIHVHHFASRCFDQLSLFHENNYILLCSYRERSKGHLPFNRSTTRYNIRLHLAAFYISLLYINIGYDVFGHFSFYVLINRIYFKQIYIVCLHLFLIMYIYHLNFSHYL